MSLYLNVGNESFIECVNDDIFIDKSLLIAKTNSFFSKTSSKFMCVTRPRRFGKTMALSLLNAYYSKGCDSKELFKGLKISQDPSFDKHLNKHNVLWIDMGAIYTDTKNKGQFVDALEKGIKDDLGEAFHGLITGDDTIRTSIVKIGEATGERFIFLIDEWDVIYREEERNAKLCDEYTNFLRSLFKSSDVSRYVDLVYMTGILPIRRYNSQSALNNFIEYNMLNPRGLEGFFGFTEGEVKSLCDKYHRDFDEIKSWYDGYRLKGLEIYNPRSVVMALIDGECGDYWTSTASIEPVREYMGYDGGKLKGRIAEMLSGGEASVDPLSFENDLTKVDSEDAALTVLIHLGYLSYDEATRSCRIPNKEIAEELIRVLRKLEWDDLANPISGSRKLLEETLKGNTGYIDSAFDANHADLATVMNKNKEDVLSVITNISYYHAKNFYNILWEPNCPTGRADAVFIPKKAGYIPIVIELKADKSPEEAIGQIKERNYASMLNGYHGKLMLLGIAYDSKSLKHHSKIEYVEI